MHTYIRRTRTPRSVPHPSLEKRKRKKTVHLTELRPRICTRRAHRVPNETQVVLQVPLKQDPKNYESKTRTARPNSFTLVYSHFLLLPFHPLSSSLSACLFVTFCPPTMRLYLSTAIVRLPPELSPSPAHFRQQLFSFCLGVTFSTASFVNVCLYFSFTITP